MQVQYLKLEVGMYQHQHIIRLALILIIIITIIIIFNFVIQGLRIKYIKTKRINIRNMMKYPEKASSTQGIIIACARRAQLKIISSELRLFYRKSIINVRWQTQRNGAH